MVPLYSGIVVILNFFNMSEMNNLFTPKYSKLVEAFYTFFISTLLGEFTDCNSAFFVINETNNSNCRLSRVLTYQQVYLDHLTITPCENAGRLR